MKTSEPTKDEYKKALCDTFKHFIEICNKNNLQYYVAAGTWLGAIRHKGIIPWDDDIDVNMPRADFEKLMSLKSSIGPDFEILDYHTQYYSLPFAKFCNANTTVVETLDFPCVLGVYIDVFPIDEVGDEQTAYYLHEEKLNTYARYRGTFRKLHMRELTSLLYHLHLKTFARELYYTTLGRHNRKKYLSDYLSVEEEIRKQHGDKCMYYGGFYSFQKEVCDKKWFGKGKTVPFEDFYVTVPDDSDAYLSHFYGDYMVLPPIEFRESHHGRLFVDLNKRWTAEEINKMKIKTNHKPIVRYE